MWSEKEILLGVKAKFKSPRAMHEMDERSPECEARINLYFFSIFQILD